MLERSLTGGEWGQEGGPVQPSLPPAYHGTQPH